MAQFVQPNNNFVVTQGPVLTKPVVFTSQVLQQPIQIVQNRFQLEEQSLLRKETTLSVKLRKFLFYSPLVFFLILLVSSSVIYGLRFQNSNNTTPAAVQVLTNLEQSYSKNPILELRVLPKYKNDDTTGKSVRNTCDDLETIKGTVGAKFWDNKEEGASPNAQLKSGVKETEDVRKRFEQVNFNDFGEIREGCVCVVQKYGIGRLSYHDVDHCEQRKECEIVRESKPIEEKVVLGSIFCVRRAKYFQWKKNEESCSNFKYDGVTLRECGQNFCVSSEEGLYENGEYSYQAKNLCPISRIQIAPRSSFTCTAGTGEDCIIPSAENRNKRNNPDFTREVIHFRNRAANNAADDAATAGKDLIIVTHRELTNRPVIDLYTSISSPKCLASDLQRPQRNSHNMYKLQQVRESGCWPYGAHLDNSVSTQDEATVQNVYQGINQLDDLSDNDIVVKNIPFYKEYIYNANDKVNVYAEVRPRMDFVYTNAQQRENQCRENGLEVVGVNSRNFVTLLNLYEKYSLAFVITSAIGFAVSAIFVVFRHKSFVNSSTQFGLHLFVLGNAIALFVYACIFWALSDKYNVPRFESDLLYQGKNNCYMYEGQSQASKHLYELVSLTNHEVFGLTTFLFVVDVLYLLGTLAAVLIRRKARLNICEPAQSEQLYYE